MAPNGVHNTNICLGSLSKRDDISQFPFSSQIEQNQCHLTAFYKTLNLNQKCLKSPKKTNFISLKIETKSWNGQYLRLFKCSVMG